MTPKTATSPMTPFCAQYPLPRDFSTSNAHARDAHDVIPGAAHTYAKGDDQYPEHLLPIIARGQGASVWDMDGNHFVEFGSGVRAVTLGHVLVSVTVHSSRNSDAFGDTLRGSWTVIVRCGDHRISVAKGTVTAGERHRNERNRAMSALSPKPLMVRSVPNPTQPLLWLVAHATSQRRRGDGVDGDRCDAGVAATFPVRGAQRQSG